MSAVTTYPAPFRHRPAEQQYMLQFAADPIPTVRVAFIGLGMRGLGAVKRMTHIPGVETVDFCDVKQENTEKCNHMLAEKGCPCTGILGDTNGAAECCSGVYRYELARQGRDRHAGDGPHLRTVASDDLEAFRKETFGGEPVAVMSRSGLAEQLAETNPPLFIESERAFVTWRLR